MPSCGPARVAPPWPSGGRSCLTFNRSTAAPSTALSCTVFSIAITRARRTRQRSMPSDAILALDDSVPTGTYVDMCSKLPLVDPAKIIVPTIIMRGEFDGIAGFDDLIEFYKRLPNPDKQFTVMPGISHASFQQKNYRTVYHILHAFFTQPEPVYRG